MEVRFRPGGRQAPRPPLARRAGAPHFVRRAWTGLTAVPAASTAAAQRTRPPFRTNPGKFVGIRVMSDGFSRFITIEARSTDRSSGAARSPGGQADCGGSATDRGDGSRRHCPRSLRRARAPRICPTSARRSSEGVLTRKLVYALARFSLASGILSAPPVPKRPRTSSGPRPRSRKPKLN